MVETRDYLGVIGQLAVQAVKWNSGVPRARQGAESTTAICNQLHRIDSVSARRKGASQMNTPKRHHFLPESYLLGFAQNGYVCLFDREQGEYRRQQPRNTAVITNFYTVINKQEQKDYGIEQFLAGVEGKAAPIISKLDKGENITATERIDLALFIALLLTRTPKFEREITEIADRFHKIVVKEMIRDVESAAELLRRSGNDGSVTPESMLEFVQQEKFRMVGNRNIAVRTMLDQTEKITKDIALMDWCVVHSDRPGFVTTDSPLGFIVSDDLKHSGEPVLGLASPKITKVIPLTYQTALLIAEYGARLGHFSVTDFQTRELNNAVVKECERFVIGRDKLSVRQAVRRSNIHKSKPGTRMKVENIPHPSDPLRSYLVARRVAADAYDQELKIKPWRID
jgi:hypothetical protein